MTGLVIIGGSDAGTEAALRARRVDPDLEITMLVADRYLNYSICGLPFLVSGEVADWHELAHRTIDQVAGLDIRILLDHRARAIDVDRRIIDVDGETVASIAYDHLVIATGALPVQPAIRGLDDPDVHVLHTMDDGIGLAQRLDGRPSEHALVVGTGYIGVEMADALTRHGVRVTLAGRAPSVLPTIDTTLGGLLVSELERNEVEVLVDATVASIDRAQGSLVVTMADGRSIRADLVVVGAGVGPDVGLARSAGVTVGATGAIRVTRRMETNIAGVYAAGDCVETWHALLGKPTYLPLGTTAHKQGKVAGENAAGADTSFAGSLGTQVVKVFDLAAARTGLSAPEAIGAGFTPTVVQTDVPDHKRYYPGARDLHIRIVGDEVSGRLLGAQIVGHWQSDVAKRIDIIATALHLAMSVRDLIDLDLSYTPPLGAPWDPIQAAADAWLTDWSGRTQLVGRR